jgi:hypothetical protein
MKQLCDDLRQFAIEVRQSELSERMPTAVSHREA